MAHTIAGVASIVRSIPRRAEVWQEVDLPDLAALVELHAVIEAATADTIAAMRRNGFGSWAEIGRALGTTRQAAHERYGRRS